jgi:alpha-tubulin suppressor-like RCC1 family protein
MYKRQQKLAVSAAVFALLAGCGGGGGGDTAAPAPAAATPATTAPVVATPAPAAVTPVTTAPVVVTPAPAAGAAVATLASPTDNRFAWNIETGITVSLKDPSGAAVSPISCQSADSSLVAVRSDCSKVTLGRLGAQNITVSGGGYAATVALKGVPQRYWNGQHGVASSNGGDYSLLALADGTSLAWGANEYARLGQNKDVTAFSGTSTPLPVLNASGALSLNQLYQVSAGTESAFALSEEGNVWGWGRNGDCNLAQANCGNSVLLPIRLNNAANNGLLASVAQVESGASNQVALLDNGTVMTWGYWHGQGDVVQKKFPGLVKTPDGSATLGNIVAISAGSSFSTALGSNGKVYAWGYDLSRGSLGAGVTFNNPTPLPYTVKKLDGTELANIVSISSGYNFSLAIATDGSVWGWGDNSYGQLGQNAAITNGVPYAVQIKAPAGTSGLLSNIVMVAAGGIHALALDNTGKVFAWGNATSGQLGDGSNRPAGNASQLPRAVVGTDGLTQLSGIASIAAGYGSSSALKTDGTVLMWGDNFRGALGRADVANANGTWVDSPVPGPVVANAAKDPLKLSSLAAYPNLLRRSR